jgi:hypothetical protein
MVHVNGEKRRHAHVARPCKPLPDHAWLPALPPRGPDKPRAAADGVDLTLDADAALADLRVEYLHVCRDH